MTPIPDGWRLEQVIPGETIGQIDPAEFDKWREINREYVNSLVSGDFTCTNIRIPTFEFDGHRFVMDGGSAMLTALDVAYRARRGDPVAIELLDGMKVNIPIVDERGLPTERTYWPIDTVDQPHTIG